MKESLPDLLLDHFAFHAFHQCFPKDTILVLHTPEAHGGGVKQAVAITQGGKGDKAGAERIRIDDALPLRFPAENVIHHLTENMMLSGRRLPCKRRQYQRRIRGALTSILWSKVDNARRVRFPPALQAK